MLKLKQVKHVQQVASKKSKTNRQKQRKVKYTFCTFRGSLFHWFRKCSRLGSYTRSEDEQVKHTSEIGSQARMLIEMAVNQTS